MPSEPFSLWEAITRPSVTNALVSIVVALALGAMAAAFVLGQSAEYRSSALLEIEQPRAVAASGDIGVIDKLNRLLPKYAALARTTRIIVPAAERAGVTPGEAGAAVFALPLGNTLLLSVSARTDDRVAAQQIAQSVADEITAYASQEQEANGIPLEQRFQFKEIQAASGAGKVSPTRDDAVASGAVAALVGLAGAYVVLQVVTARRRL